MQVKDLNESQLKKIFCAATGWHSQLNGQRDPADFDQFYEGIKIEWNGDRWTVWGGIGQIELTEKLFFRCGMSYAHTGKGGTAFDIRAVFKCFSEFGLL
ncbi:MAG TPA: hypothetical protein VEV15_14235 [Flavisolibacter sp.]|nr:hypothetical protein [Flavisolibacter sp.]